MARQPRHPPAVPIMAPARMTSDGHRATLPLTVMAGVAMVAGPGDELAASAAARGYLRVSHAEREQVIGTLKAAFVHGMLARDEFDLRVGQAFASRTYAELAAVTADLPAGSAVATSPVPARAPGGQPVLRPGRVMAAATALYAGVQAFVFLSPWPAGSENDPSQARIALFFLSNLTYLFALLVGVLFLIAGWHDRRSSRRPPQRPAPGGELPSAGHGHQHTAEAGRSQPPRPPRRAHGHRGDGAPGAPSGALRPRHVRSYRSGVVAAGVAALGMSR